MNKSTARKKPKGEQAPKGWRVKFRRGWGYLRLFPPNIIFWSRARSTLRHTPSPYQPHELSDTFFGINVAPGITIEHDDYIVARLKELGLLSVRIDYGYGEDSSTHAARLIDRLHSEGFSVLLHLVPPMSEAIHFGEKKADRCWQEFVDGALTRFAGKIVAVEIGSTINRFHWSGYSMTGYVHSATLASRICRERGIPWYGPNVTDYSPFTNIGVLGLLRSAGALPAGHTNNLFVDRAGQPENYDLKVGFNFSRRLDMSFTNKARWLAAISRYFGAPRTISTYSYWTLKIKNHNKPRYVQEDQYARYLVRYCTMAAAGGLLDRVYWGQMISHFKGIIDDGSKHTPLRGAPHHTWELVGKPEEYTIRPAFRAYATLVSKLNDARFCRRIPAFGGTYLFEFARPAADGEKSEERSIIGWTRDGMQDNLESYFGDQLADIVHAEKLDGAKITGALPPLCSTPIYLTYRGEPWSTAGKMELGGYLARMIIPQANDKKCAYQGFQVGRLRGIVRGDLLTPELNHLLSDPEALFEMESVRPIKNSSRGRLADIPFPPRSAASGQPGRAILKRFNPRRRGFGSARSWAARCWDNSARLNILGVATPRPLLLIEDAEEPARQPSYLIMEKIEHAVQMRTMLKAYRKGMPAPVDVPREIFLRQFGLFINDLHRRGVFHRDLTGGNILLSRNASQTPQGPQLKFSLIDTARVRFYRRMGGLRRHWDLARLHLPPEDRRAFYYAYHRCRMLPMKKNWWQYRLVSILYRIKYTMRKPSRVIRALRG